eukprot:403339486
MNIDMNLIKQYPMLQETQQKDEVNQLRQEIKHDIQRAKCNKNYSYMRNHKFFKDGVLQPNQDRYFDETAADSIQQNGDKIFQNAQRQNKDIFNEIKVLRSQSQSGFIQGGKMESSMKYRVMSEVNTHVQRQFKIDQIMRSRLDDKANKLMFGVCTDKVTMSNILNDNSGGMPHDSNRLINSQQQVSHIIFKDKYSHQRNEIVTSSDEESDSHNHSLSLFETNKNTQRHRESGKSSIIGPSFHTMNRRGSQLQLMPIPIVGSQLNNSQTDSPPVIKFTNYDLSNNQFKIKKILQSISPSRLSETQFYEGTARNNPNDFTEAAVPSGTQILRYKQVGRQLKLIHQKSILKNLASVKKTNKLISDKNFTSAIELQLNNDEGRVSLFKPNLCQKRESQSNLKSIPHARESTQTQEFTNQHHPRQTGNHLSKIIHKNQSPINDHKFQQSLIAPNLNHFHSHSIQTKNQHLKNLRKITASQIKDSDVLKDLNQKKLLFITTRQQIEDQMEPEELKVNRNPQMRALKKKIMQNLSNQMQQQTRNKTINSGNGKLIAKTSDESVFNMRQNGHKFIEYFEYMRGLESDSVWYKRVINNDNTSNEDLKKIEEMADMLLLEVREEQQKKSIIGNAVQKFIQLKREEKAQSRQEDIESKAKELKVKIIKDAFQQKQSSSQTDSPLKVFSPTGNRKVLAFDQQTVSSQRFSTFSKQQISDNPPAIEQIQEDQKPFTRIIPSSRVQSHNQKKFDFTSKKQSKLLQKSQTEKDLQFDLNKRIIEKINKLRQLQPEIQKQKSVVELRKAMKLIQIVVEDHESDEEKEKYKDKKMQIKRDLMFSHLNLKNPDKVKSGGISVMKN